MNPSTTERARLAGVPRRRREPALDRHPVLRRRDAEAARPRASRRARAGRPSPRRATPASRTSRSTCSSPRPRRRTRISTPISTRSLALRARARLGVRADARSRARPSSARRARASSRCRRRTTSRRCSSASPSGFAAAGLARYEVSSFARAGFESRHNRRYWQRRPVLGVGPGAWSSEPPRDGAPFGARRANVRDLDVWLARIEAGEAGAIDPPERLDARTARGEAAFLALRTARGPRRGGVRRRVRRAAARLLRRRDRRARRGGPARRGRRGARRPAPLARAASCSPIRSSCASCERREAGRRPAPSANSLRDSGVCVASTIGSRRPARDGSGSERAPGARAARDRRELRRRGRAGRIALASRTCCPVALSAASIRNTMAELAELGLVEKPHRSAGRVPTASGPALSSSITWCRAISTSSSAATSPAASATTGPDAVIQSASMLLSERTRQLGFVVAPREAGLVLRHVALVRLSTSRVLAVLVSQTGSALRRVLEDEESGDQAELDRLAVALNERRRRPDARAGARRAGARSRCAALARAHACSSARCWLGWRALEAQDDERARRSGDRDAARAARPARVPGSRRA